ncbi:unnamed protein product [Brassica oleracea]
MGSHSHDVSRILILFIFRFVSSFEAYRVFKIGSSSWFSDLVLVARLLTFLALSETCIFFYEERRNETKDEENQDPTDDVVVRAHDHRSETENGDAWSLQTVFKIGSSSCFPDLVLVARLLTFLALLKTCMFFDEERRNETKDEDDVAVRAHDRRSETENEDAWSLQTVFKIGSSSWFPDFVLVARLLTFFSLSETCMFFDDPVSLVSLFAVWICWCFKGSLLSIALIQFLDLGCGVLMARTIRLLLKE